MGLPDLGASWRFPKEACVSLRPHALSRPLKNWRFHNKNLRFFVLTRFAWISAAWISYELENHEEAEGYFEAALGIDISNLDALLGKALILKSKNKDFSYYNKALDAIDPSLVI